MPEQFCNTTAITGAAGAVYWCGVRVARVTQWTIDAAVDPKVWADSGACGEIAPVDPACLVGFTNRLPGNRAATGTVDFVWDVACPQRESIHEGCCCDLILVIDPINGTGWILPTAMIENFSMTVNITDAEPVSGSFSFGSNGPYFGPFDYGLISIIPYLPAPIVYADPTIEIG